MMSSLEKLRLKKVNIIYTVFSTQEFEKHLSISNLTTKFRTMIQNDIYLMHSLSRNASMLFTFYFSFSKLINYIRKKALKLQLGEYLTV